jgi:phenylalanyl-tRNA synthetase beta chain
MSLPDAQKKILEALGFEVSGGKTWQIQPPSWRGDVEGKQDIAEEVIRIHGFEHIPLLSVRSEEFCCSDPAETQTLSRVRARRAML